MRGGNKKIIAGALGGLLIVIVAALILIQGTGPEDPEGDSIASVEGVDIEGIVEDGQITQERFDRAFELAANSAQLQEAPEPGDPQYSDIRDQALNDVLDTAWILGEADERGIEVSDRQVEEEFERTKEENFQTEKEYEKFLDETGFTQEEINLRVKLQLLSTAIQESITGPADDPPTVTDEEAEKFYEANKEQFQTPASRDIRVVQAPDEKAGEQAFEQLSADNSPENWSKVAKDISTDTSSKDAGGVRTGVTEGTFPPEVDEAVFSAEQGEVIGPISSPQGAYVFQVDKITEGGQSSLEDARAQIDEQLGGQLAQQRFSEFLNDYGARWKAVTVCADDFIINRCDNYVQPIAQNPCDPADDPDLSDSEQKDAIEQAKEDGTCQPIVPSNSPGLPGTFLPFVPVTGSPQRPRLPADNQPAAQTPGAIPGATGAPGGAVPVTPGATQGGAPPQGAPQAAPPGG